MFQYFAQIKSNVLLLCENSVNKQYYNIGYVYILMLTIVLILFFNQVVCGRREVSPPTEGYSYTVYPFIVNGRNITYIIFVISIKVNVTNQG